MTPARLAELLENPGRIQHLTPAEAAAALLPLAALCAAVATRVTEATVASYPAAGPRHAVDRLISATEASERTGMSTRWLYKNADSLRFAVRTSERAVRFSERGIERWLLKRQGS